MAKSQANPLKLVGSELIDIYAADKAKIAATDWAKVHVRGDRSEPIDLPDTRKRGWVK